MEVTGYWCWSSSEYSSTNARNVNTNNGNVNNNSKSNLNSNNRVRAFIALKVIPFKIDRKMLEYPNGISLEEFFEAYYDCRKRKRNTVNAANFESRNYRGQLNKLCTEVNNGTYKIGQSICFVVTYPKKREIFAADFRDRIVHHVLINKLEPIFEECFINDNYSCRAGRGTLFGIQRLKQQIFEASEGYTRDCYIGKFDIKGFFMSINKNLLWKSLESLICCKYDKPDLGLVLGLVKQIVLHKPQNNCYRKSPIEFWNNIPPDKSLFTCDPDCGLPIGNITSQLFANYFMNDFDHLMVSLFQWYGRYVDDFYVIARTKEEITSRIEMIRKYLEQELKLTLHPDKFYIQHYTKGVKFIGSVVRCDRIYLSNTTVSNMYRAIHRFNELDPTPELAIEFRDILNSYLGFLLHGDTEKKRRKLMGMIDEKWWMFLMPSSPDLTKVEIRPYYDKRKILMNKINKMSYEERIEKDFKLSGFYIP